MSPGVASLLVAFLVLVGGLSMFVTRSEVPSPSPIEMSACETSDGVTWLFYGTQDASGGNESVPCVPVLLMPMRFAGFATPHVEVTAFIGLGDHAQGLRRSVLADERGWFLVDVVGWPPAGVFFRVNGERVCIQWRGVDCGPSVDYEVGGVRVVKLRSA